ncbi:MAG: hypothetical protein JW994_03080 [Candidatus Omnitrophica bacterium]|nr:hypothetical protein [Candidatus Omnitrophota bacterium]
MSDQKYNGIYLFLISFVILFFELVCIRWIPAYIRYMGYFSNVVLLACFLGIGTGCLVAQKKVNLINFFPVTLYILILIVSYFRFETHIRSPLMIYFTELSVETPVQQVESFLLLPLIFTAVTTLFLFLSQELGRLLKIFSPLKSYSINILGSLAGIAAFSILSFLSTSPFVWFSIVAVLLLFFLSKKRVFFAINIAALLFSLFVVYSISTDTHWSPYYKITIRKNQNVKNAYIINVNNIAHQDLMDIRLKEFFYNFPYTLFKKPLENVLILGAGCGNDTAAALLHDVKKIDAVEIDPLILRLGKKLHPNHPYQDKKVSLYVNDGRAFLKRTKTSYDLIVYGLIDSLTLTSGFSNIRLENYLFTLESFEDAKKHLKKDGLLVLYNYFREEWLVKKLAYMLEETFGQKPYVYVVPRVGNLAILVAGENLGKFPLSFSGEEKTIRFEPSTDNWPFIYLKRHSFPAIYIKALVTIFLISLFFILLCAPREKGLDFHFFFLGGGFMLLETQNIIKFALLFGSTWLVNSLVITAILIVILLATLMVNLVKKSLLYPAYILLFLFLILNYIIPYNRVLASNYVGRYLLSSILAFSPLFAAGLIFATSFKRSANNVGIAFGSNLLGAMIGGMAEYLSLLIGYHHLQFVVMGFYLLSLIFLMPKRKIT